MGETSITLFKKVMNETTMYIETTPIIKDL